MANVLPLVRNGLAQVLYPVVRTVSCMTKVQTFWNGTEKRQPQRTPLYNFDLGLEYLAGSPLYPSGPRDAYVTFFGSTKGRFATDVQLTMGATTYSNLTFMSDFLTLVESKCPSTSNLRYKLRQVHPPYPYTKPSVGSTYPTLSFGATSQRPFTQITTYLTSVGDNQFGPRFAYSWYGAAISGFPTGFLRSWRIQYPLVTDADLATIETFFLGKQGRAISFNFVDPNDGATYQHVRFDSDDLVVHHLTANQNAVDVVLKQTFNS